MIYMCISGDCLEDLVYGEPWTSLISNRACICTILEKTNLEGQARLAVAMQESMTSKMDLPRCLL